MFIKTCTKSVCMSRWQLSVCMSRWRLSAAGRTGEILVFICRRGMFNI